MMGTAILMPKDVLLEKWSELGNAKHQEKAQYLQKFFEVSRKAIENRIDNIFNKQK